MSNHKTPLTELERTGLVAHGLERHIGKPSQLADVFRQGVAWALAQQQKQSASVEPVAHVSSLQSGSPLMCGLSEWERQGLVALYTSPPPCPTCEALARTVMLDQTSHDTTPPPVAEPHKPLTDKQIRKIIDTYTTDDHGYDIWCDTIGVARAIEAAHGIRPSDFKGKA